MKHCDKVFFVISGLCFFGAIISQEISLSFGNSLIESQIMGLLIFIATMLCGAFYYLI